MPKISKRFVDNIKPESSGKDKFHWDSGDGSLKGFGIRIKVSGAASYLVQYRNKEGRTRRLVLGKVGVLTPEEARRSAVGKLKSVADGGDPSADRHNIRKSTTVAELCDLYLKNAEGRIKPSTWKMDKSRIECHVKPLLGRMSARSLTIEDIERFQNEVASGKTAKPRKKKGKSGLLTGGKGAAARTIGMLGTIFEFAKRRKIVTENVARGVKKFEDNKKKRFLSAEEIEALGKAMRERSEVENYTGIAAICALLLTGCRKNEILALPWEWVDIKASCIRFGDTKSGAQLRPIGRTAAEYLGSQEKRENSKWVFPSTNSLGHFVGLPRVLERLCKHAGLKDVTLHTLRHTFAATAAELGFSELTIAGMIGHKASGITARYAHVADSALIAAASRVSARIVALLSGHEESPQVVHIKSRQL